MLVMLVGILVYFLRISWALENDSRVGEDSLITYYIDIMYDGVDREAVTSNKTTTAKVYSDYIYVQDKLQEGLEFEGFVETSDGTIGAVSQGNLPQACLGYVVDGVSGLFYNENTRVVSFQVKNLMAGCKLTVGVKVRTPKLNQYVSRMDFYNTATGQENKYVTKSNTVHFYIGRDTNDLYKVTYRYVGDVPQEAYQALPTEKSYNQGMTVGVENDILIDGYTFRGWTSKDITINGGKFTMPGKDIVLEGSFTKENIPEYKVHYSILGEGPDEFITPKDKNYRSGSEVTLDGFKVGEVVNGYRFLGWNVDGVVLSESSKFIMPDKDVTIIGRFEKILYTVKYEFIGTNIPSNPANLLPASTTYAPGEKVVLAEYPQVEGYKFLGWYSAQEFTMPEEDVVIQGEWMVEEGLFRPLIMNEVVNQKDYYHEEEEVFFEITVKNDKLFSIYDVQLLEQLEGAEFIHGEGYTVKNKTHVVIDEIMGGTTITVQAKYMVQEETKRTLTNVVELTGAITHNNYNLDPDGEYRASVNFDVAPEELYKVTYQFIGDIPEGVEELLPKERAYKKDTIVEVEQNVTLDGYNFSGWTSKDVEVNDGKFLVPMKDIVFEGRFTIPEYEVHYSIEGDIPNGYILPFNRNYPVGSNVALDSLKDGDIINGYRFLGWNVGEVEVIDSSKFVMPNQDVDVIGKFEKIVYTVSYELFGLDHYPDDVPLLPEPSTYAPGEIVTLAPDLVLDGYVFRGWTSEEVFFDADDQFVMPEEDVVMVGTFEKLYTVSYEFQGTVIPNDLSILPESKTYVEGEKVTLATDPILDGYVFLGWTSEDIEVLEDGKFMMPMKDIVIHGVWKIEENTFRPILSMKVVNEKEYYHEKEEVFFEITVKNNKDFSIYDVELLEKLEGAEFIQGDGYTVTDATHVVIEEIPGGQEVTVQARFQVQGEILKTLTNTVELTKATKDEYNSLDPDVSHVARADFHVANLGLEITTINEDQKVLEGAKFGLYQDSDTIHLIREGQRFNVLEPNQTYYLKEIRAPKGYVIDSKVFTVNVTGDGEIKVGNLEVVMESGIGKVNLIHKKQEDKNSGILSTLLPTTGDHISIFVGLFIISIVGIVLIVFYFIKGDKTKENEKEVINKK